MSLEAMTLDIDLPSQNDAASFAGFVLDRSAAEAGAAAFVLDFLDTRGLNPLLVRVLTTDESRALLQVMRSGTDAGPIDPGIFIPVVDLCPTVPARAHLLEFPGLDNARLYKEIYACRKALRSRYPELCSRPLLEASRNAEQAWQFVRGVMPEQEPSLSELIELRRRGFVTPFRVLKRFSEGGNQERAKVEVVDFQGQPAVCKTFRPGQEHFLRRELETMRELRERMLEVPEVLAYGENWLVMPLYEDSGRFQQRNWLGLLPLEVATELIQVLEELYKAGYAHLDVKSTNVIFDEEAGLKILDFEFAYRYADSPESFAESYDIVGAPEAAARTLVPHGIIPAANYANRLQHLTGLDLKSLRHDPRWKQHLKRALYVPTGAIPRLVRKWLIGHLRPALRQMRREGRQLLRRLRGRGTLHQGA